ncbi:MAG: Bacterial regulatory protein, arsR family [Methanomassiliicoccales archaeon PtaU1.Bin124]|nr:MAG: Bacterial regulatory protein, arsR family [Methanomassiliicoccales archaeon PtaU1.Bin124]
MAESEEIMRQLESLQNEVRALNRSVNDLRVAGANDPLAKKVTLLLSDDNMHMVDETLSALRKTSDCANRTACLVRLREELECVVDLYSEGRTDEARRRLDLINDVLCSGSSPCMNTTCSDQAKKAINETAINMELTERLIARNAPTQPAVAAADEIASALDPLSYPARVRILETLSQKECNFTELSQALELRTGHLQHHLRPLRDAGYVRRMNGRGRYSITPKGSKMLNGAKELVAAIRM